MRDELEARLIGAFGRDRVRVHGTGAERLPNTSCVALRLCAGLTGRELLRRCPDVCASVGAACHAADEASRCGAIRCPAVVVEQRASDGTPATGGSAASRIVLATGVEADWAACTVRLSVGRETDAADIAAVVAALQRARDQLCADGRLA